MSCRDQLSTLHFVQADSDHGAVRTHPSKVMSRGSKLWEHKHSKQLLSQLQNEWEFPHLLAFPMIRSPAQSHPTPDDVCGTPWSRRSRVFARCSSAMHYPLTCFIAQVVQSWLASWILRTRIPLTTALTRKAPRQTCKLPTDNTPAFRKLSKLIRSHPSSTQAWEIRVHILQNSIKNCVKITDLYCA